jgi:hypothetical protein
VFDGTQNCHKQLVSPTARVYERLAPPQSQPHEPVRTSFTAIKPALLHPAYETALYAHDWIADPSPNKWEQLRNASRALETERLNYFR